MVRLDGVCKMRNQSNYEKFQRRVKERYFWYRLGVVILLTSTVSFVIVIIGSLLDIPFNLFKKLLNFSLYGIFLGSILTLFLGRLGWSRSKLTDFFLNRLSIVLMIGGLTLGMSKIIFTEFYFGELDYGFGITIAGVILWLLGLRFQTSIDK